MPTKTRICVIGAGKFAATVHYPSLVNTRTCEVAGMCDLNPERLAEIGARFNISRQFTDYKAMLAAQRPDAVYIILQPQFLEEPVKHCLELGLHVFIEKPPGLSTAQLAGWIESAEKHGCKTMVGFNRRFAPVILEARRIVEESGPITHCLARYYKNQTYENAAPHLPGLPHSILLYDAIHSVDFLRWLGGEVAEIDSRIMSIRKPYQNSFNALLRFKNGACGILSTHFASGGRVEQFEMHGYAAAAFIEPPQTARILQAGGKKFEITAGELTGLDAPPSPAGAPGDDHTFRIFGFLQECGHFMDCIQNDRQPQTRFQDAFKTLELAELIVKRAAAQGG